MFCICALIRSDVCLDMQEAHMLHDAEGLVNIAVSVMTVVALLMSVPLCLPSFHPHKLPFHLPTVVFHPSYSSVLCSVIVSCFFVTAGSSALHSL